MCGRAEVTHQVGYNALTNHYSLSDTIRCLSGWLDKNTLSGDDKWPTALKEIKNVTMMLFYLTH